MRKSLRVSGVLIFLSLIGLASGLFPIGPCSDGPGMLLLLALFVGIVILLGCGVVAGAHKMHRMVKSN